MRTNGTIVWFVTSDLHDSLKGPSLWDKEVALRGNLSLSMSLFGIKEGWVPIPS